MRDVEEELPLPEELTPLNQTLITPDLAVAFDIRSHGSTNPNPNPNPNPTQIPAVSAADFADSAEIAGGSGEETARTLKRPRLVWTPQLHKRFVDAVAHLGIKNAVPKTIMQLMSVDGLTRENVASHLQKYRLYLKRMQGFSGGGGGGMTDAATERLFASSPVPTHFLQPGTQTNSDHFLPFVPVSALLHHGHQAAVGPSMGHFPSPPNSQFDPTFLRQEQQFRRIHQPYVEDLESSANGGRTVLTLFPIE